MPEDSWYEILGIDRSSATEVVVAAVERLSRQASAMANTSPERSQLLRDQVRAIKRDLLASAATRTAYDAALALPAVSQPPRPVEAATNSVLPGGVTVEGLARRRGGRFLQFLQTGWTCPMCGEGAMPSDKFCPRCGADIPPPVLGDGAPRVSKQAACRQCGRVATAVTRFCTGCGLRRDTSV